ncbi:MAG: low molecular weight protein arginine phosphatase [Lentisphaerae bacterium]|nr:low molecular weight protein arginine phosphatase [Lentisphaerota bacterium]
MSGHSEKSKMLVFVCTGNVCRSPMAECLLKHRLGPKTRWSIASAGTSAGAGMPASPPAVEALREMGLDLTPHRSRPLTGELVDRATLLVVMTESQKAMILAMNPGAAGKVFLLKEFDSLSGGGDISDPIGLSVAEYRKIRDEIDNALLDLILHLERLDGRRTLHG